jgi:hypothetical protein
MAIARETLYETLGVARDARTLDVERAYQAFVAEMAKDTTPPDERREARMREAFEVLSDPARRAQYDASLLFPVPARRPAWLLPAAATGVMLAVGLGYWSLRPAPPARPSRAAADIQLDVSRAMGKVQSVEMSGRAIAPGYAFAVERGVMLTVCEIVPAGAQVVVTIGTRQAAARLTVADESRGLCKIAVDGGASWPAAIASGEPAPGDKVFTTALSAAGEATLAPTTVKAIVAGARGKVIEVAGAVPPGGAGGPLLDATGRVAGVALPEQAGGAGTYALVNGATVADLRPADAKTTEGAAPAVTY